MPLFQNTVITKHLKSQNQEWINIKWELFKSYFHNPEIQENIRSSKEEQFQEGFLRELFVNIFDYTLNPQPNFNLTTEQKNVKDSKKADGAILVNDEVKAVIELKGTNTTDLSKIEIQAFGYKNNQPKCTYVITSNFEKLRFYIDNAIEHIEFNLFTLNKEEFDLMVLCLAYENIKKDIPSKIKKDSLSQEDVITKELYKDYSLFKKELYQNLVKLNPQFDKLTLFKQSQTLLDRFLFLFFAEDRHLLPPNSVRLVLSQWKKLQDLDAYSPLFDRYKKYFGYLNTGFKGKNYDVFAYNGGLFKPNEVLDAVQIDDELLYKHTLKLSEYDFDSEVDVNILGHIFENSLNEIDEVKAEIEGKEVDKGNTKRKKDGVFYTPKYITKYIVENTVGKLCNEKKVELEIHEDDYATDKKRQKKTTKILLDKLTNYRDWLIQLTICDPACGSGAFLNQALDFLILEHGYIDELQAKLFGDAMVLSDVEKSILENNLFGVDLNEESVEIAKLSLWLRTAVPNRKLNDLSNNIKCGNSLIDDPEVAGEKAFNWEKEFPHIFDKGGFDVVIGNPPYGAKLDDETIRFYRANYDSVIGHSEVYYIFSEKAIKTLCKKQGIIGYIIPNAWLSNKYARKLREILLTETSINNLINFNRKIIFEDANVETSIFILRNNIPQISNEVQVGQDLDIQYSFNQNEWLENDNFLISFASNHKIDTILKKINSAEYKLFQKLDISNGFKPYQAKYGINLDGLPLTSDDVKNRIYHSDTLVDNSYKKEIKGKGVKRYSFQWEESYIKWGKWLMSSKSEHYFEKPKILLRQVISDYLFAYLDNEKYYADQSLYVCTNFEGENESLEYYTALLNSKLYGFYFRKYYSEEDDLFPKIKVNELKNLPIKNANLEFTNQLSSYSITINNLIRDFQDFSQKFHRTLQREFVEIDKLTKKLESWYELTYADFLKELKKKKVVLSLGQKAEWEDYFIAEQEKALALKAQIDQTDKEIDQMVYELYELTEEEIKIVEES
ncbi:Eco57I restriction-modification methylase domain-containing protein [Brumimicrobium mesophilum]|uniref:Eco57I restriction-modification methylase domain-containing protein n=1 Tax=Brumimicrobium mesophilum TaxID=392717 RepID=UPI000D13F9A5|nr:TaqI-like C-terminal specificity domain-containing protein [Brumimicrobium mesophilum]